MANPSVIAIDVISPLIMPLIGWYSSHSFPPKVQTPEPAPEED